MAVRLGLAVARLRAAPARPEPGARASGATSGAADRNIMAEADMNNIVRAVQDAVGYPLRVRSTRRPAPRPLPSKPLRPATNNSSQKQRNAKSRTV